MNKRLWRNWWTLRDIYEPQVCMDKQLITIMSSITLVLEGTKGSLQKHRSVYTSFLCWKGQCKMKKYLIAGTQNYPRQYFHPIVTGVILGSSYQIVHYTLPFSVQSIVVNSSTPYKVLLTDSCSLLRKDVRAVISQRLTGGYDILGAESQGNRIAAYLGSLLFIISNKVLQNFACPPSRCNSNFHNWY